MKTEVSVAHPYTEEAREFWEKVFEERGVMDARFNFSPRVLFRSWVNDVDKFSPVLATARVDGKIVGMAQFFPNSNGSCDVHVNTLTGHRHCGVATACMHVGVFRAREVGIAGAGIMAMPRLSNVAALRLFSSLGFSQVGTVKNAWMSEHGMEPKAVLWLPPM